MKILTCTVALLFCFSLHSQNLALTATASASASSGGTYGPANWNDGVINGSTFGWVGTDPNSFTTPAWMELTWASAQTFDSIMIFNVGTNFSPPSGNGVVFNGTANLEYWDGSQWVLITSFSGQGTYGSNYALTFSPVTTTKFRFHQITTTAGNHNPGFDEIEVYQRPVAIMDLAILSYSYTLDIASMEMTISAEIENQGNQNAVPFSIGYQVGNNPPVVRQFISTLHAGVTNTYIIPNKIDIQSSPSPLANEELCVFVSQTDDTITSNDSICEVMIYLHHHNDVANLKTLHYPNPSDGAIILESGHPILGITVYDLSSRRVFEEAFADKTTKVGLHLNLNPGMYLFEIKTERGITRSSHRIE